MQRSLMNLKRIFVAIFVSLLLFFSLASFAFSQTEPIKNAACRPPSSGSGDFDIRVVQVTIDAPSDVFGTPAVQIGQNITVYVTVVNCGPNKAPIVVTVKLHMNDTGVGDTASPGAPSVQQSVQAPSLVYNDEFRDTFVFSAPMVMPFNDAFIPGSYYVVAKAGTVHSDPNVVNNYGSAAVVVASPSSGSGGCKPNSAPCIPPPSDSGEGLNPPPAPPVSGAGFPVPSKPTGSLLSHTQVLLNWPDIIPTSPTCTPGLQCDVVLDYYIVEWAPEPNFQNPPFLGNCPLGGQPSGNTKCARTASTTSRTSRSPSQMTITNLSIYGTYYFKLKAIYKQCIGDADLFTNGCTGTLSTGIPSDWSPVAVVRMNNPPSKPILQSPANMLRRVVERPVILRWTEGVDPDGDTVAYQVFFGDGNNYLYNFRNVTTTSVDAGSITPVENCKTYHWHLRAWEQNMDIPLVSPWSDHFRFTTACPPAASIQADETFGRYPLTVHFQGQAIAETGYSIASYQWDFGDSGTAPCTNITSTEINPVRTYPNPGTYVVCFRAIDSGGLVGDWAKVNINVTANVGNEFGVRTGASTGDMEVALSFNDVDKQYLVVWSEGANHDLYGKVLAPSPSGSVTVARDMFSLSQPSDGHPIGIAFDGQRYLVVWSIRVSTCGSSNAERIIRGQFLDRAGNQYGTAFDIGARGCTSGLYIPEEAPRVTYTGGKYLVVWERYLNNPDISPPSAALITPPASPTDLPIVGSSFTLNFPMQATNGKPDQQRFNLASDGSSYLVTSASNSNGYPLYGIRIDVDGNQDAPFLISSSGSIAHSLVYNPVHRYYLVTWTIGGIQAALVDPLNPSTKVLQGPFNIVQDHTGFIDNQFYPNLGVTRDILTNRLSSSIAVFDGLHFLVVWWEGCIELFGPWIECPPEHLEELRGIRLLAHANSVEFLDNPATYGIPISCSSLSQPECAGGIARPFPPVLKAAPGPTSVPASITPETFNMLIVWPDFRNAIRKYRTRSILNNGEYIESNLEIWAVMTHAATPIVQPLIPPTPPPDQSTPGIDLSIGDFTFSPVIMKSGVPVTITSTIRNDGTQAAGPFAVRYYWSTTLPVSTGTLLYDQGFNELGAGTSLTQSFTVSPPTNSDGTYYLGVFVDQTNQVVEANENNNISLFALSVDNVSPETSIFYPQAGAILKGQVPVFASANDEVSGVAYVAFYLDGQHTFTDIGGPQDGWVWLWDTTAVAYGSHTLAVKAFDAVGNVGSSTTLTIQVDNRPVLTLAKSGTGAGIVTSSPAGINCGATCSAPFTSGNSVTLTASSTAGSTFSGFSGGCTSATTTCTFTAAANATVTASFNDTQMPTTPSSLVATVVSSTQINLTWTASTDNMGVTGYRVERCQGTSCTNFAQIATPAGASFNNTGLTAGTTYRYRVRAADAAGNLSAFSNIVNATTSAAGGPDLTMLTVGATVSGSNLTISDVVRNQGNANAGAFNIGFYLSTDTTYQATDPFLCQRALSGLAAVTNNPTSGTATTTCSISTIAPGLYYVIGRVDSGAVITETNETNNTFASSQIAIGPDLIVSLISASKSSNTLTIQSAVKNQENATAGASEIGFYLSTDQTLSTASDTFVCKRAVTSLAAGASDPASSVTTTTCTLPAVPAGSYYVIGYADSAGLVIEARENNNTQTGAFITVP